MLPNSTWEKSYSQLKLVMKTEISLRFDQKSIRNWLKNVQTIFSPKSIFALRVPKVLGGTKKHCHITVRAGHGRPEPLRSTGLSGAIIFEGDGTKSFIYEQMDLTILLISWRPLWKFILIEKNIFW